MLNGVGFLLILGCVFGSFLMSGGKMAVIFEALPHELLAIVGAAIGAFVVGNSSRPSRTLARASYARLRARAGRTATFATY